MTQNLDRILTTHTGSLPRGRELTALYAARQKSEAFDAAAIAGLGRESVRNVVARQAAAGIDVGNDGEQMKDGFFLYLKHRLTGLGGSWQRSPRADVERYPEFKRMLAEQAPKVAVDARTLVPKAVGEVSYISDEPLREDCRFFKATLEQSGDPFVDTFLTAPPRGLSRPRSATNTTTARTPISKRSAARCRLNTKRSSGTDFCCRSMRPTWGWSVTLPMHSSRYRISSISPSGSWRPSTTRSSTSHAIGCACMFAGAITKVPTIAMCR